MIADIKIKLTTSYGCRSISIDQPEDELTPTECDIDIFMESQADFADFVQPQQPIKTTGESSIQPPPVKRNRGYYTPQIVLQAGTFDMLIRLSPIITRYLWTLKQISNKFVKYRNEIVSVISNICKNNRAIPKIKMVLLPFIESLTDQIIEEVYEKSKSDIICTQNEAADICLELLNFCIDDIINHVIENV